MDTIIHILGAASLGHMAADLLSQFERLPDKPFKCNMCMSFWLSIIPFIFIYGADAIFISAISSIISEFIYKKIIQ
jgi:hypothetical protein